MRPSPTSICTAALMLFGIAAGCTFTTAGYPVGGAPSAGAGLEYNIDRPGSDYRNFDLPSTRPEDCRDACFADAPCVAFTYVNPGVQGPSARCWLKNNTPAATPSNCCVSGVKGQQYAAAPPPPPPPPQWTAAPPPPQWTAPAPSPPAGSGWEMNTDRPGSDYNNFDLPTPNPQLCSDACARDARCAAFTYVNPGVQGPNARCWLKNPVPAAHASSCCVSGVKAAPHAGRIGGWRASPPPGASGGLEYNVDRAGSDFANFDLPQARPELCREACLRDHRCAAFTYVNPGVQGSQARCWLKNPVPAARPSSCCVSGVR